MQKLNKYIVICVLFVLIILIRWFEADLFYDPYLTFFQSDYLYIDSPRREIFKLALFTSLRYFLNSGISLGILYAVFKDKSIIKANQKINYFILSKNLYHKNILFYH